MKSRLPAVLGILAVLLVGTLVYFAPSLQLNFDVSSSLGSRGILGTVVLVFFAGVLVSLTPCLYPMIPITLSVIGARAVNQSPLRSFARSATFVGGMALVYSALGYVGAVSGKSFGFLLQSAWVNVGFAVVFFAMGLSMLGLFNVQLPASIGGKLQGGTQGKGGFLGAFLMGCATAIVASPCGGPVLVGVLTLAASKGEPSLGVGLLFAYGLGIGMLFLVLGTFPAFLKSMPKSGTWMEDVKYLLGVLLILVSVFVYLHAGLAKSPMLFWVLAIGAGLGTAMYCALKSLKRTDQPRLANTWRGATLLILAYVGYSAFANVPEAFAGSAKEPVVAVSTAGGETTGTLAADGTSTTTGTATAATKGGWLTNYDEAVALAKESKKPLLIDFTADWCAACKQLDRRTFPDSAVQAKLSEFVRVKIDCTEATPENDKLQQKYGALSLPAVTFVTPDGRHLKEHTLYTFESPAAFVERLNKVTSGL